MKERVKLLIRSERELRLILPFVGVLLALVLVSAFSIEIFSFSSAYVAAESLWSKSQKDAVIHLMRYADGKDEEEFRAYERAIAVPLSDRKARLELTSARPDYGKAVAGLLGGGNDPNDIPGMIRLVRRFGRVGAIDRAVRIWTRADDEVAILNEQAERLHAAVRDRKGSADRVALLLQQIQETDERLTPLEEGFSSSLSQISRQFRSFLMAVIGIVAILLLLPGILIIVRDVRRERRKTLHLAHQASHDALTGLFNRIEFERRLSNAIDEVHEYGSPNALLYLDLDEFKTVNDTCGHAGGDELIRQIAGLMRARVRETDIVARLGGDEFGILLVHCDAVNGLRIAEAIRGGISQHRFVFGQHSFAVGVSIGVLNLGKEVTRGVEALNAADAACYLAKRSGRNCVVVCQ